ncbi:MAG: 50S ribosomal protein L25 [Thermoguttaceae bacterium]|nr:50S ribosomal protein L25 [Thermoguttaceae bacterium]
MVELLTLSVERREEVGKRRNRRLRESGKTPAVLYGHKKEVVNLTVPTEMVEAALRDGSRFVQLSGGVSERVFIKEVQWNVWGDVVLHVDFTRVRADEILQLTIPVVLRGEAPGIKEGGVVKQHLHMIEIEAKPVDVPENILVGINELGFDEQIRIADLDVPEGVKLLADPETIVVECSEQIIIEEPETEELEGVEPEIIGREHDEKEEE